jgi:hypothetical protein
MVQIYIVCVLYAKYMYEKYMNLDLTTRSGLLVFYQVFEWPTQRPVSISLLIDKPGDRSSYCAILTLDELQGRGPPALYMPYEIETYENLFYELFGQII